MCFRWLVCLVLASIAFAQAAPPAPTGSTTAKAEQTTTVAPDQAPESEVGPNDAVLTVKGICANASQQGDDCETVVTKEQFEKLADGLQPNMSPAIRRQLANQYSRALVMSAAAEKRGLDKQPRFGEVLRFARMQILSQELNRALQEDAGRLTDADLEEYYGKNAANFEEADFLRIFVPRNRQIVNPKPNMKDSEIEAQQKAGEVEMKNIATGLHARATQGEDFDKLQKEAFVAAGLKGTPPDPKMNKVRRTTLPPKHGVALNLKAGEVSELISDPSGYYIYKLVDKQNLPLDSVKAEIRNALAGQRYRDAMQLFQKTDNVELNDAYFGPAPKAPVPPPARGGKPAQEGEVDPD